MKIGVNNRKVLILMLILLLLILSVGYAVFSDNLTISGTANAKGTFDLEFQNAEIVKNIGADKEKTTAEISADKNTLTVNVGDLAYPGAGVEFSVDIVNVGTMPAEVQAVTPNNITGSEKIKVTGLEGIKVGHPKIEVGDRCNIHFTVEWPVDSREISETESSISFGLQIEYAQSTGEVFDGQASHIDGDPVPEYTVPIGITATYGKTLADIKLPEGFRFQDPLDTPIENAGTNTFKVIYTSEDGREVRDIEISIDVTYEALANQITSSDYGKNVNYTATVKNNNTNQNEKVSNWKLLYKDDNKIYLILDSFLPVDLVPDVDELSTNPSRNKYAVSSRHKDLLVKGLTTESYWSEFASGIDGATAIGSPKFEILMKSYNEKNKTTFNTNPKILGSMTLDNTTDTLYFPTKIVSFVANCYWIADVAPNNTSAGVWYIKSGRVSIADCTNSDVGVRPVVSIPSSITGTIGDIIEIK